MVRALLALGDHGQFSRTAGRRRASWRRKGYESENQTLQDSDDSRESCGTGLQRTDGWVTPASYRHEHVSDKWGTYMSIPGQGSQGNLRPKWVKATGSPPATRRW